MRCGARIRPRLPVSARVRHILIVQGVWGRPLRMIPGCLYMVEKEADAVLRVLRLQKEKPALRKQCGL